MRATTLPDGPEAREAAAAAIRAGDIVGIPTDTVYGLATGLADGAAIDRVLALKGRPSTKGIALLLADPEQAAEVGILTDSARLLGQQLWPGGLTLVVPVRADVAIAPDIVGPAATIGLRVPDHACPRRIAELLGPLPATSANLSGRPEAHDGAEVASLFGDDLAVIVDDGPARGGVSSTVVDCTRERPAILRAGAIPPERIAAVLEEAGVGR